MILDTINNREIYYLNDRIKIAFEYIVNTNFDNLSAGRHNIDGENIFALVNEYSTQENKQNILEAHKKYIDLQYILKGTEIIEFETLNNQTVYKKYDKESDYILYNKTKSTQLILEPQKWAMFFPNDLHFPGIFYKNSENIKKVVVKILI